MDESLHACSVQRTCTHICVYRHRHTHTYTHTVIHRCWVLSSAMRRSRAPLVYRVPSVDTAVRTTLARRRLQPSCWDHRVRGFSQVTLTCRSVSSAPLFDCACASMNTIKSIYWSVPLCHEAEQDVCATALPLSCQFPFSTSKLHNSLTNAVAPLQCGQPSE